MKASKYIYALVLVTSLTFTGCSDFLDTENNSSITGDNFYQSEEDFSAATAALYNKVWFDFNDKFYYGMGDGRGFNLYAPYSDYIYPFTDLNETGLTGPLVSAWGALYNVVQQSNRVIIGIEGSSFSDQDIKNEYIGEARFMRGVAYSYLAMLWGNVIVSENTNDLISNPIVNTNPTSDVFEFAMRDLEFAAKYLPKTATAKGRVNKYSAYALLSRVYLTYAGYSDNPNSGTRSQEYLDLAKKAADKVITESDFKILDNYEDLFKIENNNNAESVFALQWIPNGAYGEANTLQSYLACGSEITNDAAAWGYWTRAQPNVVWEYEVGDLRRKATWMAYGDHYDEIQIANGGYTYDKTDEALNVKKYVCGSTKDNAKISQQDCPINTYMMRLAEVYLIYAEAVLGNNASTTDEMALKYFNKIRTRAGLEPKDVITYEDIRHERRMELCMEGQYWYDLVRRAYYKQQEVINYIKNQQRDVITPVLWDENSQTLTIDDSRDPGNRSVGTIDESIFLLPYPESETVQNPLLKADPVSYEFKEDRITDLFN
ncbi:RagB/SusD family nutrient uptake outer membrane protein [uncultured Bacteroides sp.]|uniref:RagB/SusD family nutrient uptake outer membrane protein n=1 Tax=uncultured Bacteroides sp. TaxID=162156 RepID=UPI002AA63A82|nr:RagB/SusD family nutrient uptake outer membrane protein [uncultured Bacteroides sp.]